MADAEAMILALVKRMAAIGALDLADINAIADELEPQDADAAHQIRMAGLEASIGSPTGPAAHQASIRRRSLRLIDPDGGNDAP